MTIIGLLDKNDKELLREVCGDLQRLVDIDAVTVKTSTPKQLAGAAKDSPNITRLVLKDANFTRADLECIKSFERLEDVSLLGCTDETVAAFAALSSELENLQKVKLQLWGKGITDATLEKIPKTMRSVFLGPCPNVTSAGIRNLRDKLGERLTTIHEIRAQQLMWQGAMRSRAWGTPPVPLQNIQHLQHLFAQRVRQNPPNFLEMYLLQFFLRLFTPFINASTQFMNRNIRDRQGGGE